MTSENAVPRAQPDPPTKLLFVCSRNKIRSLTAEKLFENSERFEARSRGTENGARVKVTAGDIGWADVIFAMEKRHADRLRERFPDQLADRQMITLLIKDIYEPMEPVLIQRLKERLSRHIDYGM